MVPPSDKLMPNFPKNTTTTKRQQQRCEERTNRAAASQVPFVDEVLMRVIPPGRMTSRPLPRNQGLWVKTTTAPCSDAETASDHSMKTKLNPQLTALMLPQTNGFFQAFRETSHFSDHGHAEKTSLARSAKESNWSSSEFIWQPQIAPDSAMQQEFTMDHIRYNRPIAHERKNSSSTHQQIPIGISI